jgi:hypothetical protein
MTINQVAKTLIKSIDFVSGTNVRERQFGVFRLRDEITTGRPHFSFLHGQGVALPGWEEGLSLCLEEMRACEAA